LAESKERVIAGSAQNDEDGGMNDTSASPNVARPKEYFTGLAEVYTRYRPSYPSIAIDAVLAGLPEPVEAVSVGCGTGICCRLLAERGARVIGIDPNEDMLKEAHRQTEAAAFEVTYQCADAEDTALPSASYDLVLCAQSFHWFSPHAALEEFHRILRPGGRVALMWNIRNDTDGFTRRYNKVAHAAQDYSQSHGRIVRRNRTADPTISGHFTGIERLTFRNPQILDEEALIGRVRSASYFPKDGPLAEQYEREVRRAFADHQRNGVVTLMQTTQVSIARCWK
jgi:ubiquinone/menaquinone biosynthesis C-methylase UbiE